MPSRELIIERLGEIEKEFGVEIIYACESGSRAWGFPSKDSDFDVRFVYYHPIDWYLSLEKKRDVIECPINELLDISGWDIAKTLRLLRKSNPNILEWAHSSIVYKESKDFSILRGLLIDGFNPKASINHYLSMTLNNFRSVINRDEINVKKYLYTIRPLLCALWVLKKKQQPPMLYSDLVENIVGNGEVTTQINLLVQKKQDMNESDMVKPNELLNNWIQEHIQFVREGEIDSPVTSDWTIFNSAFWQIIGYSK